uniref:Uncharacterized protein n=1 Tax=Kwoniella pini CBS 10737 TaxID=1296096 RepID=A0A1B9I164_9TREE|nr:uncharacterized protein I206_04975 [Kwoniella pini CBS 10737]OCF49286.1 hypothetical protein I206_04975 [Kwoniella pini CBS 10737]
MTLLLTHPHGISLSPFTKHLPSTITPTALPLPSRFPSGTTPQVVTSSIGHIYLYMKSFHIIWEYDNKGRRISEISLPGEKVNQILPTSTGGKQNVIVSLEDGRKLKVMEKHESRWKCINTLQAPEGNTMALAGNIDSTLVAAGSNTGELVVFNRIKGERLIVPLNKKSEGPISPLLTFCPSQPSTILLPTSSNLLRLTLSSISTSRIDIKELPVKGPVLDITFSPVVETADGSKKGGLCAVLKQGGEVALIGIDSESSLKIVSFGRDLVGLTFLDGATLAGRTEEGSLLVKDLRALSKPPFHVACNEPISSIQVLPRVSCLVSLAPSVSSTSSKRTPLGENQAGNVPTPPPVPILKTDLKGKGKLRDTIEVRAKSPSHIKGQEQKSRVAIEKVEPRGKERIVSAPITQERIKQPRASGSRSTSGPLPTVQNRDPERTQSNGLTSGRLQPHPTRCDKLDEIQEEESVTHGHDPSIQLDWALKSPSEKKKSELDEIQKNESEMMIELQRDLRNMHLNMLRIQRDLRKEIRIAVEPLVKELEGNKVIMESQRREIERLRRGY